MAASASAAALQIVSSPAVLPGRYTLNSLTSPAAIAPLKAYSNGSRVTMSAASPRKDADGPRASTTAAVALVAAAAALIIPEVTEAAQPGVSPSLKNLLLSVVAGGVVLVGLGGAVAAVSTFDPVKRK